MIQYDSMCSCGNPLVLDTVMMGEAGAVSRTGVPVYDLMASESATRCYCGYCGIMYHPERAGVQRYTP